MSDAAEQVNLSEVARKALKAIDDAKDGLDGNDLDGNLRVAATYTDLYRAISG